MTRMHGFALLVLILSQTASALGQTDCTGCAPAFVVFEDTVEAACGTPFDAPEIPAWSSPCGLETFEALSALTGGNGEGGCGGVSAYGPGADFALWLNGLASLGFAPSDYFLTGTAPLDVQTLPNGDVWVTGSVVNDTDADYVLEIQVLLDESTDWAGWSAGGGLAKDPLSTGNFPDWTYLLLNGLASNISGVDGTPTEGWSFSLAHNPSSEVFGFQIGDGANTHNNNPGLGGWFSWSMSWDGQDYASVGDLIIDLTACIPSVHDACQGEDLVYEYVISNECGSDTARIVVQISDDEAPVFLNCPQADTIDCLSGLPPFIPLVSDNCTAVSISADSSFAVLGCGDSGVWTRVYTALDSCGNSATCEVTTVVEEVNDLAFLELPQGGTVSCSDWSECGTFPLPVATSGCNGDSADVSCEVVYLVCDSMPSDFDALLVYTATDDCGNSISDTVSVDVVDNDPPYFTFIPPNEMMTLEEFENWSVVLPVCVDDCYVPDLDCETGWGGNGGGLYPLPCDYDSTLTPLCCGGFEILYHFFHVDLAGNEAAVDVTVTVVDATPPEFVDFPQDTVVDCVSLEFLQEPGNGISLIDDHCDPDSLFLSHVDSMATGACGGNYTLFRLFTATDNCGNAQDSLWTINVVDAVPPAFLTIPDPIVLACGEDIPVDAAIAEDACSDFAVTDTIFAVAHDESDCAISGALERWWYATDGCGNVDSISQLITFVDTIGPHFLPIEDSVTVDCVDWMGCETLPLPTAMAGGCSGDTLVVNCAVNYLDCGIYPAEFVASLVYTAENACGVSIVDSTVVTVVDNTEPYFVWVPPDTTMTLEAYQNWSVELPVCLDDCYFPDLDCGAPWGNGGGGVIECDYDSTLTPLCCGGFEILYHFFHVDLAGNEAAVDVTVTVVDATPPEFVDFPQDTVVDCSVEGLAAFAGDTLVNVQDNSCEAQDILLTHVDSVTMYCSSSFLLERTFSATDGCGNAAFSTWTVEVVDTIPPVFTTAPSDLSLACTDEIPTLDLGMYTAEDGCSDVAVWYDGDSIVAGDCPANQDIYRRVGAIDSCGNVAWHIQWVAVRDTLPPVWVSMPDDTTLSCEVPLPAVDLSTFGAIDDCSGDEDLTYSIVNESNSGDNCINFTTRLFQVEDACGNFQQFSQLITLVDTTAPAFAEVLAPDSFLCGDLVTNCLDTDIDWSDNCNNATWVCSDSVILGNCTLNECLIERTFVLTDVCGNASSMVQEIAVSESFVEAELPTGISPNGDLINDEYIILNIDPEAGILPCAWGEENEFVIFNRWGNEVYRESNYRNTWNGVNQNGEPLPEGTYFVVFTLEGRQYSSYIDLRR